MEQPTVPKLPLYTDTQISTYLSHISFPVSSNPLPTAKSTKDERLHFLELLQRYQLAAVPFENLSLHYSQDKIVRVKREELWEKIVVGGGRGGKGRGGYCMENNNFFKTVLETLGYEVFAIGARVYDQAAQDWTFGGWSHQISLVRIEGDHYLVDVGFGSAGPTRPIPLLENATVRWGSTEASNRLLLTPHPTNPLFPANWTLQHRHSTTSPWHLLYTFHITEFFAADFEVMNFATSTRKTSFFTYTILVSKVILGDEGDVIGVVTLEGGRVKRRIMGETEVLTECKTEAERVGALEEFFGIVLEEREVEGIKGTVAELR